jgi:hypothetical protein
VGAGAAAPEFFLSFWVSALAPCVAVFSTWQVRGLGADVRVVEDQILER